jgi:hypothetical protein
MTDKEKLEQLIRRIKLCFLLYEGDKEQRIKEIISEY